MITGVGMCDRDLKETGGSLGEARCTKGISVRTQRTSERTVNVLLEAVKRSNNSKFLVTFLLVLLLSDRVLQN